MKMKQLEFDFTAKPKMEIKSSKITHISYDNFTFYPGVTINSPNYYFYVPQNTSKIVPHVVIKEDGSLEYSSDFQAVVSGLNYNYEYSISLAGDANDDAK